MKQQLSFVAKVTRPLLVKPGSAVDLRHDRDPGDTGSVRRPEAEKLLAEGTALLAGYQDRLAAQETYGVLLVLQGLDASGKDGAIKHVMSGVNPAGVTVHGFKQPSAQELSHDFLWRYQRDLPGRGQIGIFNRSHYEEVLVVRVHPDLFGAEHLPPAAHGHELWRRRYREINDWERYLTDNGIRLVKIMLNISRQEQARRFRQRLDHPKKNWKFSPADIRERAYWDDYQQAFSEMLSQTSTPWAPWQVVPADHKWFARLATAAALIQALRDINPQYPVPSADQRAALEQARRELEAEDSG